MKALADENFPLAAIHELRRLGWDIVVASEWRPATDDAGLAAKCRDEGRVLLTFDKDFGELWRENPRTRPAEWSFFGCLAFRRSRGSTVSSAF
jgi:hypothetical protein